MERLTAEIKNEEGKIAERLAWLEQQMVTPPMLALARMGGREVNGMTDNMDTAMDRFADDMECLVACADYLREKTVAKVIGILTTSQSVRFLAGVAQFQLRIRRWGQQREAEAHGPREGIAVAAVGVEVHTCTVVMKKGDIKAMVIAEGAFSYCLKTWRHIMAFKMNPSGLLSSNEETQEYMVLIMMLHMQGTSISDQHASSHDNASKAKMKPRVEKWSLRMRKGSFKRYWNNKEELSIGNPVEDEREPSRLEDKNFAHLIHVSEMEKKMKTLARITTILKDVSQNKVMQLRWAFIFICPHKEESYPINFKEEMKEVCLPGLLFTYVSKHAVCKMFWFTWPNIELMANEMHGTISENVQLVSEGTYQAGPLSEEAFLITVVAPIYEMNIYLCGIFEEIGCLVTLERLILAFWEDGKKEQSKEEFLELYIPKWRAKLDGDEEKNFENSKAKVEIKSIALKAKKESSNEECLTSDSEDEEYAMAVRDFKKFFKKESDSGEEYDEKVKDETCLVAHASSEKKAYSDGGPINMDGPLNDQAVPKINMGPPPATPGSEKTVSFQKSILGPRPKHIIVNNAKVPVASDNEVKQFYKSLSKPRVGFSKPNFRSKTPPPRRFNNNYSRPKTQQPKRHVGRQNQPHGFPVTWNNFPRQSYMPWEMCLPFSHPNQLHQMQGMFGTNNFGPMRYWGPNV
ncbi:retrovirus-related pol polyprotein from transposon TNT 1-94 [Tanacetum coccineum]